MVVYPYNGMLFGHKKNEVLIYTTVWMNHEDISINEIIPFISNTQKRQMETESRLVIPWAGVEGN